MRQPCKNSLIRVCTTLILGLTPLISLAQNPEADAGSTIDDSNIGWEVGFHIGNVLPNQIDGVDEIFPQWGLRSGFRIAPNGFAEFGGTAGKGEGVEWSNLHVSLRLGLPIENLLGIVYLGGDVTYFKGIGRAKKMFGGGQVGGGLMSLIADAVWFRFDMKFNVNPGTSMYIGAGFMFRFPGGGGGGGSGN